MKIRSAILTEMSGKLGGAVGSTARGGIQYLRKLVIPSNPRTLLQTAIRNAVSSASSIWVNILSEATQTAWWDIAEGSQTGKSLFAKVNQPRLYARNTGRSKKPSGAALTNVLSYIETPPASLATDFAGITATIDDSANTLILPLIPGGEPWRVDAATDTPAMMFIFVSASQNASRFSRQHPYQLVRAIGFEDVADVTPAAIDLAALGLATITGKIMYVKIIVQAVLGGLSVAQETRVTVTP